MLLAVDIRNSGIRAGFREEGSWRKILHFGLDRSPDELALLLELAFSSIFKNSNKKIQEAWISSVVPVATPKLAAAINSAFCIDASIIGPGTKTGIKIRTDNPVELGTDIVCCAMAARSISKKAAIIVDFGSAIVLSVVNSRSELLGAAIAPGLDTAAKALKDSAAQIPGVGLGYPGQAIGKNTQQAVRSGIVLGYSHLVKGLVDDISQELREDFIVIGTGDELGRELLSASTINASFYSSLSLDGLALAASLNKKEQA